MPRISVIVPDRMVYVDGVGLQVDVSELPSYFHAIQWDGARGHIEFAADAQGRQLPNLPIVTINQYQYLLDRWKMRGDEIAAAETEKERQRVAAEKSNRVKVKVNGP